ncbi:MAG: DUF5947 family protein [Acidimicrobiales bacterium]
MSANGHEPPVTPGPGALMILDRIRQASSQLPEEERCEMCAVVIPPEHQHVVNLESRGLLCTCRACYLLFVDRGAAGGKFRSVPDRHLSLTGFGMSQGEWDALQIPVSVAFFFHNSVMDKVVAFYPSPAGATESLLALDAWEQLVSANPVLVSLEPDVEALLVRRADGASDSFLVPIDACYELVGLLRTRWRGFDGGQDAHEAIDGFFAALATRSTVVPPPEGQS